MHLGNQAEPSDYFMLANNELNTLETVHIREQPVHWLGNQDYVHPSRFTDRGYTEPIGSHSN